MRTAIHLKRSTAPPPWSAAVLPLPPFPVPKFELASFRHFFERLTALLSEDAACVETFIQFSHLHLADGSSRLAENGREWMPVMGLGVWPDRDPPTCWKREELLDLGPEDKVRQLMNIVLRVAGSRAARHHARETLFGSGSVLQFMSSRDSDAFLTAAKDLLLPPIEEPSLKGFPMYVPLLEARSVREASATQVEEWLCGADSLIRESPEDGGVFLLSKFLERALDKIGAGDEWEIRWE